MKEGRITIAELGPRLKLIRQELGITQRDLAQALNINQAIISKFENGGMVYASVLLDILSFFRGQININYLLRPGDDYDLNEERARFSNDQQRDIVIHSREKVYKDKIQKLLEQTAKECDDALSKFAEFCLSEKD